MKAAVNTRYGPPEVVRGRRGRHADARGSGMGGKKAMLPVPPKFDQELVRYFQGLHASGAFRPLVDRRYPLEQIVEAYRYVEAGRKVGNVLIDIT
jgi:NADPH:quinone reductase-like Zn-dependent oxidoreductase